MSSCIHVLDVILNFIGVFTSIANAKRLLEYDFGCDKSNDCYSLDVQSYDMNIGNNIATTKNEQKNKYNLKFNESNLRSISIFKNKK